MSISVQEHQGGGGGGSGAALGGSYLPAYRIQRASRSFDDGSSYEGDRPLSVSAVQRFGKKNLIAHGNLLVFLKTKSFDRKVPVYKQCLKLLLLGTDTDVISSGTDTLICSRVCHVSIDLISRCPVLMSMFVRKTRIRLIKNVF
jgi:hypothetical protein